MNSRISITFFLFGVIAVLSPNAAGQAFSREVTVSAGSLIEVVNKSGRIDITAEADREMAVISASSAENSVAASEILIETRGSRMEIAVAPAVRGKRIDISIAVPEGVRLKLETREGEIRAAGSFGKIEAETVTGTIAVNVPADNIEYDLSWTASRPRIVSDFTIEPEKERAAGRFTIKGRHRADPDTTDETGDAVKLEFETARGIVLLNVPPNEVASDLRERPLTEAAKAIVRSGDSILMEAIRRASPKHFGDYTSSLPPIKREPRYAERRSGYDPPADETRTVTVRVADRFNRAITDLKPADFVVTEGASPAEIIRVEPADSPFNLVLLLDVSGSIDNYVNFIRKAARSFVETVGPNDRVSIVIFNDDVKVLSGFTTDKALLSESLDTFDAGGGTAYYDALAYTLADTLRPLRGERTAIVILTDGDDNRSFLAFDTLAGSIQESGALIYPLYVPSALVAASANDPSAAIDPMRSRFMTLTSKAEAEGPHLAEISGGVYYPITRLSDIQAAYDDIVTQLRTAYSITFRPTSPDRRFRITVTRENTSVVVVK